MGKKNKKKQNLNKHKVEEATKNEKSKKSNK